MSSEDKQLVEDENQIHDDSVLACPDSEFSWSLGIFDDPSGPKETLDERGSSLDILESFDLRQELHGLFVPGDVD